MVSKSLAKKFSYRLNNELTDTRLCYMLLKHVQIVLQWKFKDFDLVGIKYSIVIEYSIVQHYFCQYCIKYSIGGQNLV